MKIWKHGTYIDTWSLVHLLSGFVLGSLFYYLGFNLSWAFTDSLIVLMIWEVVEALIRVIERPLNVVSDIVIGILGFSISAYLYFFLNTEFSLSFFFTILGIHIILAVLGFLDFLKRGFY